MKKKPFSQNYILQIFLLLFLGFWFWTANSPVNRFNWILENLLVIFFVSVLAVSYYWYSFSNLAYAMILFFLLLHLYGAHYSYAVPWDLSLQEWFGWERRNYDRIVHFSFGFFFALPVREFLRDIVSIPKKWINPFVVITIFSAGAFYELIEMWVTLLIAPEQSSLFLGTQGDPWDAQHDMELAMYGAILMLIIRSSFRIFQRK